MAKRGRPRHPDILTPREWEVLALVREGLSNEQIAERLGTTERTARYHVSEILGKLGVSTRQEAAAWQPEERRPWWALALAPLAFGRRVGHHWLAPALAGAAALAGLAALAFLIWGLARTQGEAVPKAGATALAVGEQHACALLDGGVRCWGRNIWGELGDGANQDRSSPVQVIGLGGRVAAISAGAAHTCALFPKGNVTCWGYNIYGQLGDGGGGGGVANANSPQPVDVVGLTDAIAIAAGGGHTCALTSAGGLKCWGDNTFGQLGDGTTTMRNTPVDVKGLTSGVQAIATGGNFTCALLATGGVKCWGNDAQGELGAVTSEQCSTSPPTEERPPGAGSATRFPCSTAPLDVYLGGQYVSAVAISAAGQHVCAQISDGTLKCWGSNAAGELGSAEATTCNGPPPVEPCSNVPLDVPRLEPEVSGVGLGTHHTCAITSRGAARCWGDNQSGQLGDGTMTQRAAPVDVAGLGKGVVAIGGGDGHTCALFESGGVKCWGADDAGQLGDGTNGDESCSCRTTPVDVVGLRDSISAATAMPLPPDQLAWLNVDDGSRITSAASPTCGDATTASADGVPREIEYTPSGRPLTGTIELRLGLEAEPYDYIPAQVHLLSYYTSSSTGWEISQRPGLPIMVAPGFVSPEFFLRRLDRPGLLFRYGYEYCVQADGTKPQYPALGGPRDPSESVRLPADLPYVVEHRQGDYLSLRDVMGNQTMADEGRLVWAALGTPDDFKNDLGFSHFADLLRDPNQGPNTVYWVVLRALGDGGGPHRAGHELGSFAAIDASGNGVGGASMCCIDLIFAP